MPAPTPRPASDAAPDAQQVADRWHIWSNLCDAVEKEVARHRGCLAEPPSETVFGQEEVDEELAARLAADTAALAEAKYRRIGQTRARYLAVHELLATGASRRAIADRLGLAYNTVRRYAAADSVEQLLATGWQNQPTILDEFKPYLHERLRAERRISNTALFRQIRDQGYRGSYGTVAGYLRELRAIGAVPAVTTTPPPKTRDIVTWITTHPEALDEAEKTRLKAVLECCPELKALAGHVRDFADILTHLRGELLNGWLNAVYFSELPSLHSFANGIGWDRDAVLAGLTLPWSSGAVEGTVNRIKMLMRQTFGRAGFPLLRQRILLA